MYVTSILYFINVSLSNLFFFNFCVIGLDNISLHLFPNPDKDPDRFRTWVYAIGGDILALDNSTIFKNRRICHSHFEPRYHTRSGKLSANAVPTLHLAGNHIFIVFNFISKCIVVVVRCYTNDIFNYLL